MEAEGDSVSATGTVAQLSGQSSDGGTPPAFYKDGDTIKCPDADVDDTGVIDSVTYTKRNRDGLRVLVKSDNVAGLVRSCTSGVTDMSLMFGVRTPPSRVLLFFCRRDGGGGRHPSPRSEIAAHSPRPPVPRRAVDLCLQSSHR
jgi:hypothetical protein